MTVYAKTQPNGPSLKAHYEVTPNHVPNWLRLQIIRLMPVSRYDLDGRGALMATTRINALSGSWLDHWGSATINGQTVFVSEPYADASDPPVEAIEFARRFDLRLEVRRESAWNPPSTIRLVFFPPEKPAVSRRNKAKA